MRSVAVFAAAVLFLAYYCNEPVPDGVTDAGAYRAMGIFFRTLGHVARLGEKLGIAREPHIRRDAISLLTNVARRFKSDHRTGLKVTDTTFDGVKVRIYEPAAVQATDARRTGLVFYHGGGWAALAMDDVDEMMAHIAKQLGNVLVGVDYRLAPEYQFPASFDDCLVATKFFLRHTEDYNVDPKRVGVGGDSAGGNLAAAVAIAMTKEKEFPKLKVQTLLYPALQAFDFNTDSYKDSGHLNTLPTDLMISFWLWYLNDDLSSFHTLKANNHTTEALKRSQYAGYVNTNLKTTTPVSKNNIKFPAIDRIETILDPRFAPLMADDVDLKKMPPTYVMTVEHDVLRDDGVMYARRLEKLGVPVRHDHYKHGFHCCLLDVNAIDVGREAMENYVSYLKKNL
ncbi:PREDICTED: neutral cholesterol ester hydrolase 1-like [Branchiostoma belcheri]|uniref:Neutral cholesterol ester hydrolase 1-like n=1 Tax=Branchiostoma belcheri TaxID=7741 RepID=A0A6P5AP94_BRABE|nr:PREDICTED: neutral cholesterol ester hydrolase 1-like [Branchiostoma belcheri]